MTVARALFDPSRRCGCALIRASIFDVLDRFLFHLRRLLQDGGHAFADVCRGDMLLFQLCFMREFADCAIDEDLGAGNHVVVTVANRLATKTLAKSPIALACVVGPRGLQ